MGNLWDIIQCLRDFISNIKAQTTEERIQGKSELYLVSKENKVVLESSRQLCSTTKISVPCPYDPSRLSSSPPYTPS